MYVDTQSVNAENRRGENKKKKKQYKPQDKNVTACPIAYGGHNQGKKEVWKSRVSGLSIVKQ